MYHGLNFSLPDLLPWQELHTNWYINRSQYPGLGKVSAVVLKCFILPKIIRIEACTAILLPALLSRVSKPLISLILPFCFLCLISIQPLFLRLCITFHPFHTSLLAVKAEYSIFPKSKLKLFWQITVRESVSEIQHKVVIAVLNKTLFLLWKTNFQKLVRLINLFHLCFQTVTLINLKKIQSEGRENSQ